MTALKKSGEMMCSSYLTEEIIIVRLCVYVCVCVSVCVSKKLVMGYKNVK